VGDGDGEGVAEGDGEGRGDATMVGIAAVRRSPGCWAIPRANITTARTSAVVDPSMLAAIRIRRVRLSLLTDPQASQALRRGRKRYERLLLHRAS
jgi:hypothetical protein